MAKRTSGSESKPARAAARRRTDKAPKAAASSASDSGGTVNPEATPRSRADDDQPTPADVARRAYELYLERGSGHGHDLEDWYEAERQLRRPERKEPSRG